MKALISYDDNNKCVVGTFNYYQNDDKKMIETLPILTSQQNLAMKFIGDYVDVKSVCILKEMCVCSGTSQPLSRDICGGPGCGMIKIINK